MTSFVIDFSEVFNLGEDLEKVGPEIQRRAEVVVAKTAFDLEAQAKANIVSMEAVETGNMLNGTTTDINGLTAEVGPTADYAGYVHEGTWKMDGRPFLTNAADVLEPVFQEAMGQISENLI